MTGESMPKRRARKMSTPIADSQPVAANSLRTPNQQGCSKAAQDTKGVMRRFADCPNPYHPNQEAVRQYTHLEMARKFSEVLSATLANSGKAGEV